MDELWSEFLDKCEFIYLTDHPMGVPMDWLGRLEGFTPEDPLEARLLEELREAGEFRGPFTSYLKAREEKTLVADPRLQLRLVAGDPTTEPCDALLVPHDSDYVGPYALKKAGLEEQFHGRLVEEPQVIATPEQPFARLVLLPRLDSPEARALRLHVRKGLMAARQAGAKMLTLTHIPSVSPDLSEEFEAAEVISVARAFLREFSDSRIRLTVFRRATYPYYRHWIEALGGALPPKRPQPRAPVSEGPARESTLAAAEEALAGSVALGQSLFQRLREGIAGTVPYRPVPLRTFELRQALAHLELESHEGALRELAKLDDQGYDPVLPTFLRGVIVYDRVLRGGPPEALEPVAREVHTMRRNFELGPEAMVAVDLLLALSLRAVGRAEQATAWFEGARRAASVLEDAEYEAVFPRLAAVFAGDLEAPVRWEGTARLPDQEQVVVPVRLEAMKGRLF